jgi:FAD/FMN-containing dehydrogenase
MGLTGLIIWAELQLKPLGGLLVSFDRVSFNSLDEFFTLAETSDREWDYTVAWLDIGQSQDRFGRGILTRGNFVNDEAGSRSHSGKSAKRWPVTVPGFFLNRLSIRTMNRVYYRLQSLLTRQGVMDYERFFFPLDAIADWNRIYGPHGFFQYQCVIPHSERGAVQEILARPAAARLPATLAVLKAFGDAVSPGMMSFPRPGFTLSLDFPNRGKETLKLLDSLDEITLRAKGAVYPAKDARMSPQAFQTYFPQWREFARFVDPKFSSSFWRRVTASAK